TQFRQLFFVCIFQVSWDLIPIICSSIHHLRSVQHVYKISPAQIFISECAENEIDNGCSALNIWVIHHSCWFKPGEHKLLYKFFQRNSILQADRNSNSKTVQHGSHGSAFLRHVNEDLPNSLIRIFTGAQEHNLSVDLCFLSKAPALSRQCSLLNNLRERALKIRIWRSLHSLLHFI